MVLIMGIKWTARPSEDKETESINLKPQKPVIELSACTKCGGCIEVAPDIFQFNEAGGYIEVCDQAHYDQELVDEAIKICPEDCIEWEDS